MARVLSSFLILSYWRACLSGSCPECLDDSTVLLDIRGAREQNRTDYVTVLYPHGGGSWGVNAKYYVPLSVLTHPKCIDMKYHMKDDMKVLSDQIMKYLTIFDETDGHRTVGDHDEIHGGHTYQISFPDL
eukprot:TRINITY_DN62695_c0_g1_i1.p1 TRINITY_DN62695_c0_g1~~TRINITY_DN62695_c0_g1_i1.p1  ORF type:complete len:130 (+),score=13.79 TRINITY_DN62695_c0_g1_i1:64-453(+)